MKTAVLIVDPMPLARKVLSELFARSSTIEVVAAVSSPRAAERIIRVRRPDVIVFDLQPPYEADADHLGTLRDRWNIRLLLFSSLGEACERRLAERLTLVPGEITAKPTTNFAEATFAKQGELESAIWRSTHMERNGSRTDAAAPGHCRPGPLALPDRVIAIGASTGGTEALAAVLSQLPRETPGLVVVQHMPGAYTRQFADRLNGLGELRVREAKDGDALVPGLALLAPGGVQMAVVPGPAGYRVRVRGDEMVNGHCPSVDVLMYSVARHVGARAIGVLLTGMGADGALGMKVIREGGGGTIAQDEASSVVYGMPREALRLGGVERVVPLGDIARQILVLAARGRN